MTTASSLTSRTPRWPVRVSGFFEVETGDMAGDPQPAFELKVHPNTNAFVGNPFASGSTAYNWSTSTLTTTGSRYRHSFVSESIAEPLYDSAAFHLIASNV